MDYAGRRIYSGRNRLKEDHMIFNALARKVVLKGKTMEQYPPAFWYTK
jgi:hypothetical protein